MDCYKHEQMLNHKTPSKKLLKKKEEKIAEKDKELKMTEQHIRHKEVNKKAQNILDEKTHEPPAEETVKNQALMEDFGLIRGGVLVGMMGKIANKQDSGNDKISNHQIEVTKEQENCQNEDLNKTIGKVEEVVLNDDTDEEDTPQFGEIIPQEKTVLPKQSSPLLIKRVEQNKKLPSYPSFGKVNRNEVPEILPAKISLQESQKKDDQKNVLSLFLKPKQKPNHNFIPEEIKQKSFLSINSYKIQMRNSVSKQTQSHSHLWPSTLKVQWICSQCSYPEQQKLQQIVHLYWDQIIALKTVEKMDISGNSHISRDKEDEKKILYQYIKGMSFDLNFSKPTVNLSSDLSRKKTPLIDKWKESLRVEPGKVISRIDKIVYYSRAKKFSTIHDIL